MAFSNAKLAIRTKLVTEGAVVAPGIPLAFPNEFVAPPGRTWVFVNIVGLDERIVAFGGGDGRNEWEVRGEVHLVVHFPLHSGLAAADKIRDDLARVLRGKRFSGVSCWGATPFGGSNKSETGTFYTTTAVVDFTFRFTG